MTQIWAYSEHLSSCCYPKNAVLKHVNEEDKLNTQIEYAGQRRNVTVINESGLYALIFGSKLESSTRFKNCCTPKNAAGELMRW